MRLVGATILSLTLTSLPWFAAPSDAYVEIQLKSGRSILANSFTDEGDKLHLYRPTGEMKIDRGSVSFVIEHEGVLSETNQPVRRPQKATAQTATTATSSSAQPAGPSLDDVEPLDIPEFEDLAKVEQQLTRDLILKNRDLLFARNRGDDTESLDARRHHIKRIQKTRNIVNERLQY